MRGLTLICLALRLLLSAAGASDARGAELPAEKSGQLLDLDTRLDIGRLDRAILAAAIFAETNRVRENLRLPLFRRAPKLDEAADLEAAFGRVSLPPSHTNPFPRIGTPLERVKFVGLKPRLVAENIALLSSFEIDANVGVGVAVHGGRREFVNSETQELLRPATYRGFATEVVKAWMQSPGHRENLVNPALQFLGCSVQPNMSLLGVPNLFCVQVFFTPASPQ